MLTVSLQSDLKGLNALLNIKTSLDKIQREAYSSLLAEIIYRIHTQGLKGDGNQIGTYTPEYLRLRSGQFKDKVKKGKKRILYNRGTDPKVILSLTRHLEKDYAIVQIDANTYGIEVKSELSAAIIERQEENYGGGIYTLTEEEHKKVIAFIDNQITTIQKDAH